jgi:hypothetical protein
MPLDHINAVNRLNAEHAASVAAQVQRNDEQRAEIKARQNERERQEYLKTPAGKAELARQAAEQVKADYAAEIMGLPEAALRPSAAARIAEVYNAKAMPASRAKLFLAGLPVEETEQPTTPKATVMADPTIKRRVEIRLAALSQRADSGDLAAKAEAKKLSYALKLTAETSLSLPAALQQTGCNVAAIR